MHRFTKSVCLVLTAALTALLPISTFAYQNEPDDFRGIKWDTPIAELLDMVPALDGGDLKAYTRKHDNMRIGGGQLGRVHYIFYKDRFYCVHIEFEGLSNFDEIREVFFHDYGRPTERQYVDKHYQWKGNRVSITLDYDTSTGRGEVGYKYIPIHFQVDEDEERQVRQDAGRPTEKEKPHEQ